MPRFLCPNFATLSEFIPSSTGETSHGDCGWLALLLALHAYNATRYPLTGDGLASVRDDAIRNGYAEANGAVNIPNLDRYLTDRGIPHTTVGYDQFTLDGLHTLLKSYATGFLQPVIVECSNAGTLPEDEAGVQYHYYTTGGIDTDIPCYFRGDGDAVKYNAWPGFKDPIQTSWDEIVASNPIAWIVIHGVPTGGTSMPVPAGWRDNGSALTAPNGVSVTLGFRDHILAASSWPGELQPEAPAYGTGDGGDRQDFRLVLDYHPATNVTEVYTTRPTPPPVVQQDPTEHQIAEAVKTLVTLSAQVK